jgi:hypothetical protein
MNPTDENQDAVSAVLAPLRDRARDRLDEVTAARVLARAEAALSPPAQPAPRSLPRRWLVPAGLMLWGALYLWAAVGEIRVIYPRASDRTREVALTSAAASQWRRPTWTQVSCPLRFLSRCADSPPHGD